MKKFFMTSALALIIALSGCGEAEPKKTEQTENSETAVKSTREDIPFEDGQLYAAALIGYQSLEDFPWYQDRYLDGDSTPLHHVSDGEYYLIIPRYPDMHLSLYKNNMETMIPEMFFEEDDAEPFIIQCNMSDIFADTEIRLEYEGEEAVFTPYVSLKDGAVEIGEKGLNLTKK